MNTIDILKTHNAWRRGDDTRTQDELGFSVTELGMAIDDAVRAISERDQLRAEPVAYAVFAGNGNIRIWSADPIQAKALIQEYGDQVRPLYAVSQPAEQQPDFTLLLELLSHARCNTCDGSGGLYDNHGHPHQCQWCHDRSEALAAYRKQETSHENQ